MPRQIELRFLNTYILQAALRLFAIEMSFVLIRNEQTVDNNIEDLPEDLLPYVGAVALVDVLISRSSDKVIYNFEINY
jgi:hypothetical protein